MHTTKPASQTKPESHPSRCQHDWYDLNIPHSASNCRNTMVDKSWLPVIALLISQKSSVRETSHSSNTKHKAQAGRGGV